MIERIDIDAIASDFAKLLQATEAWVRVSRPSEERAKLETLYKQMIDAICQIEDIVNNPKR